MILKCYKSNLSILVPRALLWPSGNAFVPEAPGDSTADLCDWMAFSPSACVGSSALGGSFWQIDRLTLFTAWIHLLQFALGEQRSLLPSWGKMKHLGTENLRPMKDNCAEITALTPSRLKLRVSPNSHKKTSLGSFFFFLILPRNPWQYTALAWELAYFNDNFYPCGINH